MTRPDPDAADWLPAYPDSRDGVGRGQRPKRGRKAKRNTSRCVDGRVPPAILVMLDAVPPDEAEHMLKLLQAHLAPLETAANRRERELGGLATLLESTGALNQRPIRVERRLYDETRTAENITSGQLVETYGTWLRACKSAASLDPGGGRRPGSPSLPWASSNRDRPKPPRYEEWEIIRAIQECAEALGRWPSSHTYERWVMERRRRALRAGEWPIRLPRDRVIERVFGSWVVALGMAKSERRRRAARRGVVG